MGSIFFTNISPPSLSEASLIFLKISFISPVYECDRSAEIRGLGMQDTYPTPYTTLIVTFNKHWPNGNSVGYPLDETAFLVERHYTIGANI